MSQASAIVVYIRRNIPVAQLVSICKVCLALDTSIYRDINNEFRKNPLILTNDPVHIFPVSVISVNFVSFLSILFFVTKLD